GDHLVERGLAVAGAARGRAGEGHVAVERRVLVARRRLDRGDDLPGDAQLREVAKARLAVRAVVADGLVEPDQSFLDEVVAVASGQEVRRGLQADEAVVPAHEPVVRVGVALLGKGDQEAVIYLKLTLRVTGQSRQNGSSKR